MTIRQAIWADIPKMVAMLDRHRANLEQWDGRFWKRAVNASRWSKLNFRILLLRRRGWMLVADSTGTLEGFVVALPRRVPPVYAPGSKAALIDDFCVTRPELYPTVGAELLGALRERLRLQGFDLLVVVTACADEHKVGLLRSVGLAPTSQWWTGSS